MNDSQIQCDLISRFLHTTTEPFDNWDWDGNELLIFLRNKIIERYSLNDLKSIIKNFEL
jgi:hypothetical protein